LNLAAPPNRTENDKSLSLEGTKPDEALVSTALLARHDLAWLSPC
jgi:hypothetical protein